MVQGPQGSAYQADGGLHWDETVLQHWVGTGAQHYVGTVSCLVELQVEVQSQVVDMEASLVVLEEAFVASVEEASDWEAFLQVYMLVQ